MTDKNYYCKNCKKLHENENCANCSSKGSKIEQRTLCTEPINSDGDLCNELLSIDLTEGRRVEIQAGGKCPKTHHQQEGPTDPGNKNPKGNGKGGIIALVVIIAVVAVAIIGYLIYKGSKKKPEDDDDLY